MVTTFIIVGIWMVLASCQAVQDAKKCSKSSAERWAREEARLADLAKR